MQHLHQVQCRVRRWLEARIDEADIKVDFFGQWHHRQTAVLRHELVDQGNAHALFDQGHGFVGIGERQQRLQVQAAPVDVVGQQFAERHVGPEQQQVMALQLFKRQ
ncbi:hypothetical protein D3C80_1178830 [compost metagenome]